MAISSTRGTKKTIDEMVLMAWKFAGMGDLYTLTTDPQMAQVLGYGREQLDVILDQLVNVADVRFIDFHDVTCIASTQSYVLPEEIIDVIGDGAYIPASEASTETPSTQTMVVQVGRSMWHQMTAKDATGTPTMMYLHRGVEDSYQNSLKLWPLPTEAGTVRLQVQRPPADTFVGSETIDLKSGCNDYILHELASRLCYSGNGDMVRARTLRKDAQMLKREMRIFAAQHAPHEVVLNVQPAQKRSY